MTWQTARPFLAHLVLVTITGKNVTRGLRLEAGISGHLQVGPADAPKLWWQHAARAVLRERQLLAGGMAGRDSAGCTASPSARRCAHQRLYLQRHGPLSWCDLTSGSTTVLKWDCAPRPPAAVPAVPQPPALAPSTSVLSCPWSTCTQGGTAFCRDSDAGQLMNVEVAPCEPH